MVPKAPLMKMPDPDVGDAPIAPVPVIDPPAAFDTLPPACSPIPSLPVIDPVLVTTPAPASDTPYPVEEAIVPAFPMVQVVPAAPSMASAPVPVAVTWPVLVMVSGLSAAARTTGPAMLLLIVVAISSP